MAPTTAEKGLAAGSRTRRSRKAPASAMTGWTAKQAW